MARFRKRKAAIRGMEGATPVERLVLRTPATFRRRLLAVAAVTILALAAVSGLLAWRQYRANQHRAVNDLNARVVLVGRLVDSSVDGGISTLETAATAPVIMRVDRRAMAPYFARVLATGGRLFTGGMGWVDLGGNLQVTSKGPPPTPVNVADREYFQQVVATKKPYVSSGLFSKGEKKPTVVVAVPTFGAGGKLTGVLTGLILLNPSQTNGLSESRQSQELGFTGLTMVDRSGQLITGDLKHVQNEAALAQMDEQAQGDLKGVDGLDGGSHHVIAFATASTLDWKIAIDRSESSLYGAARRSLLVDLLSIGIAALVALVIFALLARRSRREIEERGEHAQSWSRLTRSLAVAATPAEVADALLDSVQEIFTDAVAVIAVDTETGQEIRATSSLPGWRRVPGDSERLRAIAELAHGETRTISLERSKHRELYVGFGGRLKALHVVPILEASGDASGGIAILTARTRLAASEWELLGAYAAQAARALDRARAYEHEHELAMRLQRSLLPADLPQAPGLSLAGEYLAGGTGIEIGGDWYDAVLRPDGILELCVGDVSGRGVGAATIMGRQRNTFRAYAYDCDSPAEVLRRMIRHVNEDEMITAACVTVDPVEGALRYSCAGHPPPLLLDRDTGTVVRLDGASSPPLGVAEPSDVVEQQLLLPERATLALYTDGLVERRGESIEDGIDVLARELSRGPEVSAQSALASIGGSIGAPTDDVALLIASLEPAASFAVELSAEPEILPGVRRRLRGWLTRHGFGESSGEIVLAVSEALNNAIEHAYREPGGTVRLHVSVDGGPLRVEVADRGRWREPVPNTERGRGIMLMKSMMDSVEIESNGDGTTVRLARGLQGDRAEEAAASIGAAN